MTPASKPRVSVVIDTYDYARFLPACIESVLTQDFPAGDMEVVVVDDGSTDGSAEVIARYAPRVKGIVKPNGGQASAFNRAFAETRGELVCLLDGDDVWLQGKLRRVVEAFDRDPKAGLVQHLLRDVDASLTPLPQDMPGWPERQTLDDFLEGRAVFTATSGTAYRRTFLDALGPVPEGLRLNADEWLATGTIFRAEVRSLSEVLALHRIHGASQLGSNVYRDADRLERNLRLRRVLWESVERWLKESGRRLSPRFERLEGLEMMRREILLLMGRGRRREAAAEWWRGLRRFGGDRFGLFRVLTCFAALISPSLYLAAYARYARSRLSKRLRSGLAPE